MAKKAAKKKVAKKKVAKGFVFTGDKAGGHNPAWISMHGYMFKLDGKAIEVVDDVAVKLRTHSHFTEK